MLVHKIIIICWTKEYIPRVPVQWTQVPNCAHQGYFVQNSKHREKQSESTASILQKNNYMCAHLFFLLWYVHTDIPLIVNQEQQRPNYALPVQLPLSSQTSVIMLSLIHCCFVFNVTQLSFSSYAALLPLLFYSNVTQLPMLFCSDVALLHYSCLNMWHIHSY